MTPSFLDLPARAGKPRRSGLTHVLDRGVAAAALPGVLAGVSQWIDVWKFGFGTAYLDVTVPDKLTELARHGVAACVGGTLLEVAWSQGRAEQCLAWAADQGFGLVEVSNGAAVMPADAKRQLIRAAAGRFTVVAEVGSKDPGVPVDAAAWAQQMAADLDAGASWVIAEARESGTVGLYRPDGTVREDVVEAVVAEVGPEAVIFEAPRREQQVWLLRRFGPDANLANIPPDEVLAVEALRVGLRADTMAAASRRSGVLP